MPIYNAGACLSWRLIAAIYSKWASARCVFAGPDKNEFMATDLETDYFFSQLWLRRESAMGDQTFFGPAVFNISHLL